MIALVLFLVVALAVFGIVAQAFGTDSRELLRDTRNDFETRRAI